MSLFHAGLQPAIDSNGDPISGATWNFYATGTTTPVAVYADSDLSTSLGAVVTANSVGRFADIYLDDVIYRAILKDAGGSNLADIDPVSEPIDATTIMFIQSGAGAVERTAQSKMRDAVSVKDFGAVGDGVTDDTAAIQAAVLASKSVDFGGAENDYIVNGEIQLQSGQFLFGTATVRQSSTQTVLFNADACDNVTVCGLRMIGKSEAVFVNTPSSLAMAIRANGASDVLVEGCRFENFYYTSLGVLTGGTRIKFINNFVKGPGAAVLGVDVNYRNCIGVVILGDNVVISQNDIYDTATGVILGQESSSAVISDNTLHDFINEHGLYVDTGIRNVTIVGNSIRNTGVNGDGLKVQHYTSFGLEPYNITITGNAIENTGNSGISVLNSAPTGSPIYGHNLTITGNAIRNTDAAGINLRYYKSAAISGNHIYQTGTESIYIDGAEDVVITSNHAYDAQSNGVFIGSVLNNRIRVASNQFVMVGKDGGASTGHGILTAGGSYVDIRDNVILGDGVNTIYGVFFESGDQTTFSLVSNYTDDVQYGIRFKNGTDALLSYLDNQFNGSTLATFNNPPLVSVASAATLTIPSGQRVVRVTGTANITTINTNGFTGQMVTFVFDDALTVVRGSNVYVASNFITSSFDTLTLVCDGSYWLECSRSVN